ncbi:ATP-binding protein [Actinomadura sp. WMMA1423]|uniref:ATP-binding protein n=1 Tax=Actinomadura sp. WMMA1423 TaxID=2591108 RepID=UPI001146C51F|nr:ATP-binding protein [Actinomadura sp. WMMA1423]
MKILLAGQPDREDLATLVVTELVTNAYRHGLNLTDEEIQSMDAFPADVVLKLAGIRRGKSYYLRIEVYDPNPTPPDWARGLDDHSALDGRGLAMIREQLALYGAISTKSGKCVVAEYELDHPTSS